MYEIEHMWNNVFNLYWCNYTCDTKFNNENQNKYLNCVWKKKNTFEYITYLKITKLHLIIA